MPSYEFVCKDCGASAIQSHPIDQPLTPPTCLDCQTPMTRDYRFGSVTFNGSGFYRTDSK